MMKVLCTRAAKCESGATAIEYAVTAAILSVALLTGADTLASAVNTTFQSMSKKLDVASSDHPQSPGGASLVSLQSAPDEQAPGAATRSTTPLQP